MEHGGGYDASKPRSTAASGLRSGATVSARHIATHQPYCRRPTEAQPRETCGERAPPSPLHVPCRRGA
jgi:hypothetical protein